MKPGPTIERLILSIRDQRVILAGDLAMVYGVETRALNQAVSRNLDRFPHDFMIQLSSAEFADLKSRGTVSGDGRVALRSQFVILKGGVSRSQNATSKRGQHIKYPPYAFTEHGAIMAATVLNSPQAVAMSVYVVRAFVRMREQLAANEGILKRLAEIDKTLLRHDASLRDIYHKLLPLLQPPPEPTKRRIGFTSGD
jgi:hypothetical protein